MNLTRLGSLSVGNINFVWDYTFEDDAKEYEKNSEEKEWCVEATPCVEEGADDGSDRESQPRSHLQVA